MEVQKDTEKVLQWHPAFYAGIQIELQQESDNLIFENEHQLGTKPFGIDVLIVKKEKEKPIQKNIGQIFRKYNIMEYKSPTDYLSVDDFYKVYGYTCFYKADVETVDDIPIEELTISLVCQECPKKLFRHLREERKYYIKRNNSGIYYVTGDKIPIQIIVTKELSRMENLWLGSLTNQLKDTADAEALIRNYEKNESNHLYKSVMNIIVEANKAKFEEVRAMCEALDEIFKDKFDEKRSEGEEIGKERVNELTRMLSKAGRMEDIVKAAENREYQEQLFLEFGL